MNYNASLNSIPLLELSVVLSTVDHFRYIIVKMKQVAEASESTAGRIRPDSTRTSFLGRIVLPVHGLATFVPPLVYIVALALNSFHQPEWMTRFALSVEVDEAWKNAARVTACLACFGVKRLMESTFAHLGDQWHSIGRREKPRVVKSGPYAWVRHPGYSSVLLQEALWSIMFWSYVPLVALSITALAFSIKMPIEESLIQQDDVIREEYRQYMKQVPARILPYVW